MFGVCQVIFLQMKSVLLIDVDARSEQGLMAEEEGASLGGVVVRECV